jgi:hypothetical protein
MWQCAHQGTADTADDMDLMAWVEAGTLRAIIGRARDGE